MIGEASFERSNPIRAGRIRLGEEKTNSGAGAWLHLSVDSTSRRDGGCMSCGIDSGVRSPEMSVSINAIGLPSLS